jgi:hypothetical protein
VVLGAAYMLVMVPLVQRFYLLLGSPTLALVVTLEGLLLGAGLGSFISSRINTSLVRLAGSVLAVLAALLVAHALLFGSLSELLLQTDLPWRIAAVFVLSLPLGLLIGVPFPTGLRITGEWLPRAVPTMWGLNAMAAVLGSVVASAAAMAFGFQVVLLLAAVLYAGAALLLLAARRGGTAA